MLERADDVGGTWQANTYPGCQCDVPSHLYSFSFEPNPSWTRTYSRQPEIWAYLRRCADRHGLHPHLRFGHELTGRDVGRRRRSAGSSRRRGGDFSAAASLIDATGPAEPARGARRSAGCAASRASSSTPRSGTTTTTSTASASRSSARARRRSSSSRGSTRRSRRCTSSSARRRGSCPTPTARPRASSACCTAACRPPSGSCATSSTGARESFVLGFAKQPRMAQPAERIAKLHLRKQVRDPELRRKLSRTSASAASASCSPTSGIRR